MPQTNLPLIVEPDELEGHLGRPDLLIIDLSKRAFLGRLIHAQFHLPGAVNLEYSEIITTRPPAMGLLPDDRQLSHVVSSAGMTPETHVVAYDDEGNGKACRFLWTLDVIGHPKYSLLNGGLHAWLNEGHRTEGSPNQPQRGDYKVVHQAGPVADKDYVLSHLNDPGVVLLDTRTPAEFSGVDKRAARGGHIPGAVNMDWTLALDRERDQRLISASELREMLENLGITPDREVITYCQTHLRSAHTYITLKALGFPRIRGYPGSWSEWGNDFDLPIET